MYGHGLPKIKSEEHTKWRERVAKISIDYLTPLFKIVDESLVKISNVKHIKELEALIDHENYLSVHVQFHIIDRAISCLVRYMEMLTRLTELSEKLLELSEFMVLLHNTFPDDMDNTISIWSLQDEIDQLFCKRESQYMEVSSDITSLMNKLSHYMIFHPSNKGHNQILTVPRIE